LQTVLVNHEYDVFLNNVLGLNHYEIEDSDDDQLN